MIIGYIFPLKINHPLNHPFDPKEYVLKSGKTITIKAPSVSQAAELVALKRSYIRNTETIPLTLKEYPEDVEKEETLIQNFLDSENSMLLVAEYQGKLIGNIDINGHTRIKLAHTAWLGMAIHEDWRNQGLGAYLIERIIEWSRNRSDLELIWLEAYATNAGGLHLYAKSGFIECGRMPHFFKEDDQEIDKVTMYLKL